MVNVPANPIVKSSALGGDCCPIACWKLLHTFLGSGVLFSELDMMTSDVRTLVLKSRSGESN